MARHSLQPSRTAATALTLAAAAFIAVPALVNPATASALSVISVPGTDDADGADNLERTVNITGADPADVTTALYPTGFGVGKPGVFVLPFILSAWDETYNSSTDKGVAATVDAVIAAPDDTIIVVGHSQGSRAAGNAAEIIQRDDLVPDKKVLFVLLADPGFPVTGAENQFPSFIPGIYTAGDREPGDADSNVKVISVCVKTDPTCGFDAYSFSSWFYLLPGFYGHGQFYQNLDNNAVSNTWTDGNTTYVVLEPDNGENPWGYVLRAIGLPVPKEFDRALTALVPYVEPGQRTSVGGHGVPTPREIQEALFKTLGIPMPGSTVATRHADGYTVSVPSAVATGVEEPAGIALVGDQPVASSNEPVVDQSETSFAEAPPSPALEIEEVTPEEPVETGDSESIETSIDSELPSGSSDVDADTSEDSDVGSADSEESSESESPASDVDSEDSGSSSDE